MSGCQICTIPDETTQALKKFRFKQVKENAAIIIKLDMSNLQFVIDGNLEEFDMEELANELPEREPRFFGLICKEVKRDGRVTFPMMMVYVCPHGCKTEQNIMYTQSVDLVMRAGQFGRLLKVRDTEELTEDWLREELAFFQ